MLTKWFIVLLLTLSSASAENRRNSSDCAQLFHSISNNPLGLIYSWPDIPNHHQSMTKKQYKELIAWIHSESEKSGAILFKPIDPQAPEIVGYNWFDAKENYATLTQGMAKKSALSITKQKHEAHLGLYLKADPYTYANESILMEVALYRDKFPIKNHDGSIHWQPIDGTHYSRDPTARMGNGNDGILHVSGGGTATALVQDLRAIKELRYPNKRVVLDAWFRAKHETPNSPQDAALARVGQQWLMTPNYSAAERLAIITKDPERFQNFLNQKVGAGLHLNYSYKKNSPPFSIESLMLDGVLKALLQSNESFVMLNNNVIRWRAVFAAEKELSGEARKQLKNLTEKIQEGRLQSILKIISAENDGVRENAIAAYKKMLREEASNAKKVRFYYNPRVIEEELFALEN